MVTNGSTRRRRVVSKSPEDSLTARLQWIDGASGNSGNCYTELVGLLECGLTPLDCHKLTGVSLYLIREIAQAANIQGANRAGRTPRLMASVFGCNDLHLWMSVFLARLHTLQRLSGVSHYTGTVFLDALRATQAICDPVEFSPGGRYLLAAAQEYFAGNIYLVQCRACDTTHARCTASSRLLPPKMRRSIGCPACASAQAYAQRHESAPARAGSKESMTVIRGEAAASANYQALVRPG